MQLLAVQCVSLLRAEGDRHLHFARRWHNLGTSFEALCAPAQPSMIPLQASCGSEVTAWSAGRINQSHTSTVSALSFSLCCLVQAQFLPLSKGSYLHFLLYNCNVLSLKQGRPRSLYVEFEFPINSFPLNQLIQIGIWVLIAAFERGVCVSVYDQCRFSCVGAELRDVTSQSSQGGELKPSHTGFSTQGLARSCLGNVCRLFSN